MTSWKSRQGRRVSSAQLKAESMFAKASASNNESLARVQAITIEFRRQRERKRKHQKCRVKELSHRPLSAAVGHTGDASFRLGMLMANGTNGVERDDEHALILLKQSAKLGHTGSLVALGEFYQAGRGRDRYGTTLDRPKDIKALQSFQTAAKRGDPHAALRLGICLEKTDPWEARRLYHFAAQQGLVDAIFNLAMLNARLGNYKETLPMLRKAGSMGHVGALNNLGMMYFEGRGCQQNVHKAREIFSKAAALDCPFAMANLAQLHLTEGKMAYGNAEWCEADAEHRNDLLLTSQMMPIISERSQTKESSIVGRQMKESTVLQSDTDELKRQKSGLDHISLMKERSDYHYMQAAHWLELAANKGHVESMKRFGLLLLRRGQKEGHYWIKKSGLVADHEEEEDTMRLSTPPSVVSTTGSALPVTFDDINSMQKPMNLPYSMAIKFGKCPSTTLATFPLFHPSLQNTNIERSSIVSPKMHLKTHHNHYWKDNYKKQDNIQQEHDGLRLIHVPVDTSKLSRPHTTNGVSSLRHRSITTQKLLRPKAGAFFWGSRLRAKQPELEEEKRKRMMMTTRISKPIRINTGKYFVPKTSKVNAEATTPKFKTSSAHQVIKMLERNALEAGTITTWPDTLKELKLLCMERNINATTRDIYNPKEKAIVLRSRVYRKIYLEQTNMMETVKQDASKLTGRTASEKRRLGLRLTSYEKKQLTKLERRSDQK